jgi:hypothetical protein
MILFRMILSPGAATATTKYKIMKHKIMKHKIMRIDPKGFAHGGIIQG